MTTENVPYTSRTNSQLGKLDTANLAVDGLRPLGENAVTHALNMVDNAPKGI